MFEYAIIILAAAFQSFYLLDEWYTAVSSFVSPFSLGYDEVISTVLF